MLVKFAIDPQALQKESNPQPLHFDRLVDRWENYGVLVNTEELEDGIDSYEFNIRSQLQEILRDDDPPKRFRFTESNTAHVDWEELLEEQGIGKLGSWSEIFNLVVIGELLADDIGVGSTGTPLSFDAQQEMCGDVEPIGLAIADQARSWRQASAIARRGFGVGEVHETIWNERFSRHAEFSSQVVIIDAYALHDRQLSGFVKLLQMIDRDAKSCRVTLFSSPVEDRDEAVRDVRQILNNEVGRLSRGGIHQVTFRLLPLDEQEHDRRIRFDRAVYAPENSIALVFSGDDGAVPVSVGCSLQLSDDAYHPFDNLKEIENELLRKARSLNWLAGEEDFFVLYPNQLRV